MNLNTTTIKPVRATTGFGARFVNFILFQTVWTITVLGAARGLTWPGIVALGMFACIHTWITPAPKNDFALVAIAIVIGFICDSALVQSGLLQVTTSFPIRGFAPLWMLVLWATLALAINHCLGWLHERYWLSATFGAVGGPVAYFGGVALGAGEFGASPVMVALPLAILWMFVTPLLFWFARKIDGRLAGKP